MATILIAEDEPDIQRVCAIWLERAGHTVHGVCNGQEALEFLQDRQVDLLISDVRMPLLSGTDLIAWWRTEKRSTRPVIVISASCTRDEVGRRLRDHDVLFVQKPFSPAQLTETVENLLLGADHASLESES